jgi:hypothetical protein
MQTGIIAWPETITLGATVTCTICRADVPLVAATAGTWDSDGAQRFACAKHLWNAHELILGWAAFAIEQQLAARQPSIRPTYLSDSGGMNEWTLY